MFREVVGRILNDSRTDRLRDVSLHLPRHDYGSVYIYNSTIWFTEDIIKRTGRYVVEENEVYP